MPEWPTIFEAEDSDFARRLGPMEMCVSTEMDAQVPRIWEWETADQNRPKQTTISPSKRIWH